MAAERVVLLVELLFRLFLVAEHLNDLLPVHGLLYISVHFAECGLLENEVARGRSSHFRNDEYHHSHDGKHYKQQPQTVIKHYYYECGKRHYGYYQLRKRLADKLAERVHVVGIYAHDVAGQMPVKVAYGQFLHIDEHIPSYMVQHALPYPRHEHVIRRRERYRDDIQRGGNDEELPQRQNSVAAQRGRLDIGARQQRQYHGDHSRSYRTYDNGYDDEYETRPVIFENISEYAAEHLCAGTRLLLLMLAQHLFEGLRILYFARVETFGHHSRLIVFKRWHVHPPRRPTSLSVSRTLRGISRSTS